MRGLAPEEERYRHHIDRVLQWIEMDGVQESTERYDLVMRAFPETGWQPDIMTLCLGPMQLLGKTTKTPAKSRLVAEKSGSSD